MFSLLLTCLLALGSACAWYFPEAKPNAVLGRLDFPQFTLAWLLTALAISFILGLLTPKRLRRRFLVRLFALWLGFGIVVGGWEAAAFALPTKHVMDNPWYGRTVGEKVDPNLPYQRPAHLHWQGLSRGDLAQKYDDADPFARDVTFQTDHEGFHNGKDMKEAEVVFIGDSFTEAGNTPESESFVQLIGAYLGVSVRNLGLANFCPSSEKVVLQNFALSCKPKVIVWQIAESNDLEDSIVYQDWISRGRPRYTETDQRAAPARIDSWRKRSPTFQLFEYLKVDHDSPLTATFRDAGGKEQKIRFLYFPNQINSPIGNPGWPIMSQAISEGVELSAKNQVEVVVLLIPMKLRVLGPVVKMSEAMKAKLGDNWDHPPGRSMSYFLESKCRQLGIAYVDALDDLKAESAKGVLTYLPYDTHLSPAGHEVIAKSLRPAIETLLHQVRTEKKSPK